MWLAPVDAPVDAAAHHPAEDLYQLICEGPCNQPAFDEVEELRRGMSIVSRAIGTRATVMFVDAHKRLVHTPHRSPRFGLAVCAVCGHERQY